MKQESEKLLKVLLEAVKAPSNASQDPSFMLWAATTIEKILASEGRISDPMEEIRDLKIKYHNRHIN